MTFARLVLPQPGGPHKIVLGILVTSCWPVRTGFQKLPSPVTSSWPMMWSSWVGRQWSARGVDRDTWRRDLVYGTGTENSMHKNKPYFCPLFDGFFSNNFHGLRGLAFAWFALAWTGDWWGRWQESLFGSDFWSLGWFVLFCSGLVLTTDWPGRPDCLRPFSCSLLLEWQFFWGIWSDFWSCTRWRVHPDHGGWKAFEADGAVGRPWTHFNNSFPSWIFSFSFFRPLV